MTEKSYWISSINNVVHYFIALGRLANTHISTVFLGGD